MAFEEYVARLVGYIPKLSSLLAEELVNQAWREIRERRPWTFLLSEGVIVCPAMVSTGTANVSTGTTSVTLSATAAAAVDTAFNLDPAVTQCQFRVGWGGPIYNIAEWNNPVIELDRVYQETSNASASYAIYRPYVTPPSEDFLRFTSVYDPTNAYTLRLHWTKAEIDRRDPQRSAVGLSYYLSSYKADSETGSPIYELWPHPTQGQIFQAVYQRKGAEFSDPTDSLPGIIPEELLTQKALALGAQWALMNSGRFPELRGVDWRYIKADASTAYEKRLLTVMKQDEEIFLQNYLTTHRVGYPIDSNFMQTHDTSYL